MQQLDIKSFDSTPIHCYLWDDVESPKGVVQISHGMCEYAGRYHEVAQMFNEHGYIVFADDHRAHGNTETDENRGRHPGDIERKTVKDLVFFYNWLKERYHLPQVLMGHSYGSFLAQDFLQQGIAATDDVADDHAVGLGVQMRRIVALAYRDAQRRQPIAHRWVDVLIRTRDLVAGRLRQGRDAAHEGPAYPQDVQMHRA